MRKDPTLFHLGDEIRWLPIATTQITPKLSSLEQQTFIISTISESRQSGSSFAGWFWLRVSPEAVSDVGQGYGHVKAVLPR